MNRFFQKYAKYVVGVVVLASAFLIVLYNLEVGHWVRGVAIACAVSVAITSVFNTVACFRRTEKISLVTFIEIISWLSPY